MVSPTDEASLLLLDQLHLRVRIHGDHVVALRRLDASLGVGLAVQTVLDKEVASLLQVDAAVVTHEAVWVVEFVPGLYDGATAHKLKKMVRAFSFLSRNATIAAEMLFLSSDILQHEVCQCLVYENYIMMINPDFPRFL